jgi:hypothetical protein
VQLHTGTPNQKADESAAWFDEVGDAVVGDGEAAAEGEELAAAALGDTAAAGMDDVAAAASDVAADDTAFFRLLQRDLPFTAFPLLLAAVVDTEGEVAGCDPELEGDASIAAALTS